MLAGFVGQWRAADVGCQCHLLGWAQLPLQLGGLGLRSAATALRGALGFLGGLGPYFRDRLPDVREAEAFRSEPRAGCIVPSVSTALHAESCLRKAGFDPPFWPALLDNRPPSGQAARSFGDLFRGWRRAATACLDAAARKPPF